MASPLRRLILLAMPYRWWIMLAAAVGFLTAGSSIGLLMTSAYIIAKAALHPSIAELQLAIVGVRFFGISRGVFRYLERSISHEVTFRLLARLRGIFYEALVPLVPAGLTGHRHGDLLGRATRDIEQLQNFYTRVLAPPLIAIMVCILMWLLLGVFHWFLPLLLTFGLFLGAVVLPRLVRPDLEGRIKKISGMQGELTSMLIDQSRGLHEILMFNQAAAEQERISDLSTKIGRLEERQEMFERTADAAILWIVQLTIILSLMFLVPEVVTGDIDGVYLAAILLGIMAAFEVAAPVATGIDQKAAIRSAAVRMFEIHDAGKIASVSRDDLVIPEQAEKIIFEKVSFGYESDKLILKDIDLTFEKGKVYVIAGSSGAGKSTIHQLLCRFREPQQGLIKFNRYPITQLPEHYLVSQISLMEQNPAFFSTSLRENLTLGDKRIDDKKIHMVIEQTGLKSLVDSLPDGLRTRIGEDGRQLSGGERQRLAVGRTILHARPVMVFDEPTAHLNRELEQKILDAIYNFRDSHIVIIITHRLNHLEQVDQIMVMENGRIIESGTHAELMERRNKFYSMWRSQRLKNLENN